MDMGREVCVVRLKVVEHRFRIVGGRGYGSGRCTERRQGSFFVSFFFHLASMSFRIDVVSRVFLHPTSYTLSQPGV